MKSRFTKAFPAAEWHELRTFKQSPLSISVLSDKVAEAGDYREVLALERVSQGLGESNLMGSRASLGFQHCIPTILSPFKLYLPRKGMTQMSQIRFRKARGQRGDRLKAQEQEDRWIVSLPRWLRFKTSGLFMWRETDCHSPLPTFCLSASADKLAQMPTCTPLLVNDRGAFRTGLDFS